MARSRQQLWVCTIVPLDGPALGVEGRYASTTRPTVGMSVSVDTRPTPETVRSHQYRVVEILDNRATNADTRLMARFVGSDDPRPHVPPPEHRMPSTPAWPGC